MAKKSVKKVNYKANAKASVSSTLKASLLQRGINVYDMSQDDNRLEGFTADTLIALNVPVEANGTVYHTDVQIKLITPSVTTGDSYGVPEGGIEFGEQTEDVEDNEDDDDMLDEADTLDEE